MVIQILQKNCRRIWSKLDIWKIQSSRRWSSRFRKNHHLLLLCLLQIKVGGDGHQDFTERMVGGDGQIFIICKRQSSRGWSFHRKNGRRRWSNLYYLVIGHCLCSFEDVCRDYIRWYLHPKVQLFLVNSLLTRRARNPSYSQPRTQSDC